MPYNANGPILTLGAIYWVPGSRRLTRFHEHRDQLTERLDRHNFNGEKPLGHEYGHYDIL